MGAGSDFLGTVGGLVGGLLGEEMSSGDHQRARDAQEEAIQQWRALSVPQLQQVLAQQLGPSAYEKIATDPRFKQAQMQALASLQRIADSGGMTLEDQANFRNTQNQLNQQDMARRQAVLNQMAARGQANSGATLAAQLSGQAGAADRAADMGTEMAANAQRRALQAMMQQGQLGTQMQGQDFEQQSRVAQARDLMAQYNANARTRADYYNAQLPKEQYGMYLAKLQGLTPQLQSGRDWYQGQGDATRRRITEYGAGTGKAIGSLYDMAGSMGGGGMGGFGGGNFGIPNGAGGWANSISSGVSMSNGDNNNGQGYTMDQYDPRRSYDGG